MSFVHLLPAPLRYANDERVLATSFFLGILFSLFPYDYPLIWTATSPPEVYFQTLETHLRFLHASPPIVPRILHIVMAVGLLGFFIKLYRPSESNMLFDGASLVLYMCGFVVYMANIVSGLRVVTNGKYDVEITRGEGPAGVKDGAQSEGKPLGRADSLKVLAASNTILALVLVGVLILQAGQWYAERKESQELESTKGEKSVTTKGNGNTHKTNIAKKKA
ncbi:MAG: hypothetical protein LQ342_004570 [Letrouitia transgressa]|nr:MAG: hypothetical protein LQ342_004570 [Letrouitia transgressa]